MSAWISFVTVIGVSVGPAGVAAVAEPTAINIANPSEKTIFLNVIIDVFKWMNKELICH